jgi:hypothetical protein
MSSQDFLNRVHAEGNGRDMRLMMDSETASIPDMLGAMSHPENVEKAECVVRMLNAWILAKIKVNDNPEWTIDDLRSFSVAVRALGTSWELAEQAKERLTRRR